MHTIHDNKARVGNFTSSEIANLMKTGKGAQIFGAPALTYITEKNMERRLNRPLNAEVDAKPTTWGKFLEKHVFNLLGLEYKLCSQETIIHPIHTTWVGSPDGIKADEGGTVYDIKCPHTLKSFCQLVDCKTVEELRDCDNASAEKYYWQLVSNAILTNSKYAELIVYVPYKDELETIREATANHDGVDQKSLSWIFYAEDSALPYIHRGGHYQNLNIIRFEVPQSDKDLLTERVIAAGKLLI